MRLLMVGLMDAMLTIAAFVALAQTSHIDLAVVCVSALERPTAQLWSPSAVRLGESAMFFGYRLTGALFSGGDFTSGLASALRGLRGAAGAYAGICTARAGRHCSDAQTARSEHSHFCGTVRYFHAG